MDIKKENIIIISVFCLLVIVLVFINMTPVRNTAKIKVFNPLLKSAGNVQKHEESTADAENESVYTDEENNSILSDWGRDPFIKSWLNAGFPKDESPSSIIIEKNENFVLTLILISGNEKTATINNVLVREGDLIKGEKVVEIKENGVVLEQGGKRRVVQLRKSSMKVQVDDQYTGAE